MGRKKGLPPVHPGEILKEDVLPSVGMSVPTAAKALGVSRQMLHDILAERKPLSAIMCLKVARLFGSSPEVWMRLQATYDLRKAAQNRRSWNAWRELCVRSRSKKSGLNTFTHETFLRTGNTFTCAHSGPRNIPS
jgi:addiction module HigA family antidote